MRNKPIRTIPDPAKVNILGMELEEWHHKSCEAYFAVGADWATLYNIESRVESRGHATELLRMAKRYYERLGKRVQGSIALNNRMKRMYLRLGIPETDYSISVG
jgi:hypothetical protein